MSVDWVRRKLYFSNMDMVTVDGTVFTWHRIESIGLDRAARRVVVTNVQQPRAVHVSDKYVIMRVLVAS